MRVESETPDLVRQVSRGRRIDDDETIRLGMAALQRDMRREPLRRGALAADADQGDGAQAAQVPADLEDRGAR